MVIIPQTYLRQVSGSQEEMEETECLPQCDFYVLGIKSRQKGVLGVGRYNQLNFLFMASGMVIGGNVMLGFTTVFDRERKRVGFAKSTCSCKPRLCTLFVQMYMGRCFPYSTNYFMFVQMLILLLDIFRT